VDPRIFGLDPQTLFDTSITLLAMLVLFLLLSYLLFNPARDFINKRKQFIAGQLEEAASAKKDALDMKVEYDSKLAKVEEESAELLAEARKKAKKRENDIVAEANEEAHRIVVRAEKEVALEKDKVRDEMKQEMVQVATLMAGKFVAQSMDEKTQAELVAETLKDMGDDTWQN
jgi:F-type H+-transporting ATPase subunit b